MNKDHDIEINDRWILSKRGKKNSVEQGRPYAWLVEKERTVAGNIEETAIVFLTNKECPFHCLMCDLWKNTTDNTIQPGIIADQIEWALKQMSDVKHLKLYNPQCF